jgi:hypothetical protein
MAEKDFHISEKYNFRHALKRLTHLLIYALFTPCFEVVIYYFPVWETAVQTSPLSTCSGYP